jgi:hypothetical protein
MPRSISPTADDHLARSWSFGRWKAHTNGESTWIHCGFDICARCSSDRRSTGQQDDISSPGSSALPTRPLDISTLHRPLSNTIHPGFAREDKHNPLFVAFHASFSQDHRLPEPLAGLSPERSTSPRRPSEPRLETVLRERLWVHGAQRRQGSPERKERRGETITCDKTRFAPNAPLRMQQSAQRSCQNLCCFAAAQSESCSHAHVRDFGAPRAT